MKSLGGPKPSQSSVASITSFESCIFDKEVGKEVGPVGEGSEMR
jgi:hypothetical protein